MNSRQTIEPQRLGTKLKKLQKLDLSKFVGMSRWFSDAVPCFRNTARQKPVHLSDQHRQGREFLLGNFETSVLEFLGREVQKKGGSLVDYCCSNRVSGSA